MGLFNFKHCFCLQDKNTNDCDNSVYVDNQICPIGSAKSPKKRNKKKKTSKVINGQ